MTSMTDRETSQDGLSRRLEELDAQLHECLMERARVRAGLHAAELASGKALPAFDPQRDAERIQQMVGRHDGPMPLTSVEHIWRELAVASIPEEGGFQVHLDGSADLLEMFDLARFHFGFTCELLPGLDAADVVGAVSAAPGDLGIIALEERAELPWWRGLSLQGAEVVARLPFLVLEQRPADMPAFVISHVADAIGEAGRDTLVYDARWSGVLPGNLMTDGLEVVCFHRSANGVDALLAVPADMNEGDILQACASAGAQPDVLRMVGGYCSPIDVEGDADDDFDAAFAEG